MSASSTTCWTSRCAGRGRRVPAPASWPLVIDIDSFVGEVYGDQKQGAGYGYTHQLGYHPILAVRADTGEVLHIRNRKGNGEHAARRERFVDELLARVARAGARGRI